MDSQRIADLQHQFQGQSSFAAGYSPLYARLFGIVAGWLGDEPAGTVVEWLLAASAGRESFDVTLLLMAAIHREVLAGETAVAALARHYPSAQPSGPADGASFPATDATLADDLRAAIMARRESLAAFIQNANVQTNETGRGLVWLLPVACLRWPSIHLVELGASAGLNMIAERRAYRLAAESDPSHTLLALGAGPAQFTTLTRGPNVITSLACCPAILSRTGGDIAPFLLRSANDELTLTSFIWADQPQRIRRLQEGIAAFYDVAATAAPVRLFPLRLPDELPQFLASQMPRSLDAPIVIFNSVITFYLPDRGATLAGIIDNWAKQLPVPVLWLQWEPGWTGPTPPEQDWMSWTADYWPNDGRDDAHQTFDLGWVHPHGTMLQWADGWGDFLRITRAAS